MLALFSTLPIFVQIVLAISMAVTCALAIRAGITAALEEDWNVTATRSAGATSILMPLIAWASLYSNYLEGIFTRQEIELIATGFGIQLLLGLTVTATAWVVTEIAMALRHRL